MGLFNFLDPLIDIGTAWLNYDSQRYTNKVNAKLTREQRDWEERMSNTAVERRAADIEKAGGNRALAFTNGQEASTPTVQPAHMEAPQYTAKGRFNEAKLQAEQLNNLKANTASQVAATQKAGADTALSTALASKARVEQFALLNTADKVRVETQLGQAQIDEVLQRIRNLVSEKKLRDLEAQLKGKTLEDAAKLIENQARAGELGLSAKKNEEIVADSVRDVFFGTAARPGPKRRAIPLGEKKPKDTWKPRSHRN